MCGWLVVWCVCVRRDGAWSATRLIVACDVCSTCVTLSDFAFRCALRAIWLGCRGGRRGAGLWGRDVPWLP